MRSCLASTQTLEDVPVPDVPLGGGGHEDVEVPPLLEVDPVDDVPEVEPEVPPIGGGHEVDPEPVDEPVEEPAVDPIVGIELEPVDPVEPVELVDVDPEGGEEPADGEPAVKLIV